MLNQSNTKRKKLLSFGHDMNHLTITKYEKKRKKLRSDRNKIKILHLRYSINSVTTEKKKSKRSESKGSATITKKSTAKIQL